MIEDPKIWPTMALSHALICYLSISGDRRSLPARAACLISFGHPHVATADRNTRPDATATTFVRCSMENSLQMKLSVIVYDNPSKEGSPFAMSEVN